jgi:hypothetical protein
VARVLLITWGRRVALACAFVTLMLALVACGSPLGAQDSTTTSTTMTSAEVTKSLQAGLLIPNSVCLTCHTDFAATTAGEDPRVFSHDRHLSQGIPCITCHAGAGHGGVLPPPNAPVCAACHGMPMPHPLNFSTTHGAAVAQYGTAVCARCHYNDLFCVECHGLQMPHPVDWQQTHGAQATAEPDVCLRCHDSRFCARCHGAGVPHPANWISSHGAAALLERGTESCTTCHAPEYCTPCHGTPMPHPADWGKTHGAAAQAGDGPCLVCHSRADCDNCHTLHKTHVSGGG